MKHTIRLLMGVVLMTAWLNGVVQAQTPIGTRIDNRAVLQYRTAGGIGLDTASSNIASTVVTGSLALKLSKSVSPLTALPGDTITYTIAVWNSGSAPLTGVGISDTLPAALSALSATFGTLNGNIFHWNIGLLSTGTNDTVRISAILHPKIPAGTILTNRCFGNDTTGARIVASADLSVGALPQLHIQKSVSQSIVSQGDTIFYTIKFSNTGNTTLTAITMRDTVPGTVQMVSASTGVQVIDSIAVYTKDSLTIDEIDSVVIRVAVRTPLAGGFIISNTAHAKSTQTQDQSASAQSTVRGVAALSLTKTASTDTASFGDTVRYTIRFGNTGNVLITNTIITDTLPQGLTFVSGPAGSQFANGVYTFRNDSLDRGKNDSIIILTRVTEVGSTSIIILNQAQVVSDQTAIERAQASTIYKPAHTTPSVSFLKTGPGKAFAGDTVIYSISAGNKGTSAVTGIVIIDTLDPQMRYIAASQGGVYDSVQRRIMWQFPRIDSLSTLTCTVSVVVGDTLTQPATLTNRASFASNEITGLTAQAQTFVQGRAKLSIWKVVVPKQASRNDTLVYTLTVANISATRADSVIITDPLPEEVTFLFAQPPATYVIGTRSCMWKVDSISAGQQLQYRIYAIPGNNAQPGEHKFTNIANLQWFGGQASSSSDSRSDASVTMLIPFLQISKQAIRRIADIGDLVPYTITVTNLSSTSTAYHITIADNPSLGFRIVAGSSVRDSVKIPDPSTGGNELRWNLADSLVPGASVHLVYRLIVGAGALDGTGVNKAQALARTIDALPIVSGVASDRVEIRAGVFTDRGIVIGKVFYDDNQNKYQDAGEEGIKGVELMMEDGTRVTTGDDGKYSLPDVTAGEHVIRLRQETLPPGDELLLGYGEFANVASSRFVNLPASGIARVDFYVRRAKTEPVRFTQTIAKVGAINFRQTVEPKNILFTKDERLAPISIKGTQFEPGKAVLRAEAYPTLKAVADYAREFTDQNIAVSGHTDSTPIHTKEFPSNKELSEARAKAVKDYLVAKEHLDSLRVTTIGFGESQPVAPNSSKSGRALNRRVEIMMSAGKDPFENYFKSVRISIAIDYDGAVPVDRIELHTQLDTSYHFVPGSALLNRQSIKTEEKGRNLNWVIDSVGTGIHKTLTFLANLYSPREKSETVHAQTSLRYFVGDSGCVLANSCITTNTVAKTVRSKPARFVVSGVLFDAGKATLKPEAFNALKGAVEMLITYPHAKATIDGFTDSRPIRTKEFPSNVALSHARAAMVRDQLVRNFSIDVNRLQATGWGELKPVASNATDDGRKANRRVEINIYKQETAEGTLQEGMIDSSLSVGQEVYDLGNKAVFDTTSDLDPGAVCYLKVSVLATDDHLQSPLLLIDTLPAGFTLVPHSVKPHRGIDSLSIENNIITVRCSRSDSVHTYSFMSTVADRSNLNGQIERIITVRKVRENGTVITERSPLLIVRIKNQRNLR